MIESCFKLSFLGIQYQNEFGQTFYTDSLSKKYVTIRFMYKRRQISNSKCKIIEIVNLVFQNSWNNKSSRFGEFIISDNFSIKHKLNNHLDKCLLKHLDKTY